MKKLVFIFFVAGCFADLFCSCGTGKSSEFISTDSLSISHGQALFKKNCSGCHNFKQDGIGPQLSGITEKDSAEWLRKFIHSPKDVLESGDRHVQEIFASYHSVMPSFPELKEEEMNQLIAYLHTQKAIKKEMPDPLAIRNPIPEKIEASEVQAALELFIQMPSTSDKEPLTRISKMDWVSGINAPFILDQRGILYKVVNQKAVSWLDISKWKPAFINQPGLATGFGSFAFHPGFLRNGLLYTTHCEAPHSKKADFPLPDSIKQTLQWVLSEWKVSDPFADHFTGDCRELMRVDMVAGIHGIQEIIFNPFAKPHASDYGKLYIGIGDGGAVENGYAFLTHHPDHIWGTIIRIDPLGKNSANGKYGIPEQNPFFSKPDTQTVREIYADGFRNPNRIIWTENGMMLATNIGQANIEALDIIEKGGDYGWPVREGPFVLHPEGNMKNIYPLPTNDSAFHILYPAAAYDHDEGNAIAGGYEYRGSTIPEFKGKYLFGDIPTGRLFYIRTADLQSGKRAIIKEWFVSLNGKRMPLRDVCGQNRVDLRFAQDAKGEIYLFTKPDGKIYRLIKDKKSRSKMNILSDTRLNRERK